MFNRKTPLFEAVLGFSAASPHGGTPVANTDAATHRNRAVVRLLSGSRPTEAGGEAVLRLEMSTEESALSATSESSATETTTPVQLLYVEIGETSYQRLKQEQSIRVEFHQFADTCVSLLRKCASEEYRLKLSVDPQTRERILEAVETTSFRELLHLSLRLRLADDEELKAYLTERLRQELRRVESNHAELEREMRRRAEVEADRDHARGELAGARRTMEIERNEIAAAVERRRAEALREARLEVAEDERARRDRAEARVVELETRLRMREEEAARDRERRALAEAEAMRNAGAGDAIGPLRAEAAELRQRCREAEARAFEEAARAARAQEALGGLQRELAAKERALSGVEEALRSARETAARAEEAIRTQLDPALKGERDAREEVARMHSEIDTLRNKIALKNVVLKEQEKAVIETSAALERANREREELSRGRTDDATKIAELTARLEDALTKLEESARMLESNANVIAYLNRELNATSSTFFLNYNRDEEDPSRRVHFEGTTRRAGAVGIPRE